jgi:hypothetical protein
MSVGTVGLHELLVATPDGCMTSQLPLHVPPDAAAIQ